MIERSSQPARVIPNHSQRGQSAPSLPQTDRDGAPPIPTIGGFALAAIAHIKPPIGTVKS